MGCWEETCILSNLPIRQGDECYAFPMYDIKTWSNKGSLSSEEMPFCAFPAIGTYNDYGGIDPYEESPRTQKKILQVAYKNYSKQFLGDLDFIDNMYECSYQSVPLGFVLSEVYEEVCHLESSRAFRLPLGRNSILDYAYSEIEKILYRIVKAHQTSKRRISQGKNYATPYFCFCTDMESENIWSLQHIRIIRKLVEDVLGYSSLEDMNTVWNDLQKFHPIHVSIIKNEITRAFMDYVVPVIVLWDASSVLRKPVVPQIRAEQHGHTEEIFKFNESVCRILRQRMLDDEFV